jgi:mono/diheme cytochrome c family protein
VAAWLLAAASSVSSVAQVTTPETLRSSLDGVYSPAQAERGHVLFSDVCIICHPDPLWRPSWQGKNLGELFTTIVKTMPDDSPGSLSPSETADVLAYILQGNGVRAGTVDLPTDVQLLSRIRVDPPAP